MWTAEPKKETFGIFKEMNKPNKPVGIFGENFGKNEEHPSKELIGNVEDLEEFITEDKQEETVKKMTFTVAQPLHSALKEYSNQRGYPMQYVLVQLIEEFLVEPRELTSSYQAKDMKRIKTTFDVNPQTHFNLNEHKNTKRIKIRFVVEALIEEHLKSKGLLTLDTEI